MRFNLGRFFKNAAILTLTSLILRLVGMVFRIWLANSVGSEGMGLYQLILSFYMLVATFAGGGITTAVTRLVSEAIANTQKGCIRRIMLRSSTLVVGMGIISAAAVIIFAQPISVYWIKDGRAQLSLKLLALSLPFMAVTACIRGYFVAFRKVITPSLAQLFEQTVRMAVIIFAMAKVGTSDLALACGVILFGDSIAEFSSCAFSVAGYLLDRRKQGTTLKKEKDIKGVTASLLRIAAPITAGRYLTTGLRTAESMLVPIGLAAFCGDRALSMAQYGNLKGMALPLLFFPASFLSSLATLTVPELSGAAAKGDFTLIRRSVSKLIEVTATASMIIGGIFTLFGKDISALIYSEQDVGFYVAVLSPLVPFMYLESIATGCLHGLDRQNDTFKYNVIDGVLRIVLTMTLLSTMGIKGFMLIMAISNILTALLCLNKLTDITGVKPDFTAWVIKPLAALLPSLAVGVGVSLILSGAPLWIKTAAECLVAASVFLFFQVGKIKKLKVKASIG